MSLSTDVAPIQFSHTTREEPVDYRAFSVSSDVAAGVVTESGPAEAADDDHTLRTPFRAPAKTKPPRRSPHRR